VKLVVLTPEQKLGEIRRLYFETTRETIRADFERALQLLKSMSSDDERERASVYMEGLNEMRRDWERAERKAGKRRGTPRNR
jgi:hypothetical protein